MIISKANVEPTSHFYREFLTAFSLRGVSLSPELGYSIVLLPVKRYASYPNEKMFLIVLPIVNVLRGDAADQRVAGVAVRKQGADGEQHLGDGECRAPLVLQNVEADDALGVDVAVIDPGAELHFGRLEGIVS